MSLRRSSTPTPGPDCSTSSAVVVDVTSEVRWFFDGALPSEVESWFTGAGTTGWLDDRWDSYRVDHQADVGVKRRFGTTLELKQRLGPPTGFVLEAELHGQLETWQRWSPADGRVDLDRPAAWVDVDKTVFKRRFDVDGHEIALSEDTRAMTGEGCDVEIVSLSVDGRPAWGFAFAAFGPLDHHRRLLTAAWATLQQGGPRPRELRLRRDASCGYPEWLAGSVSSASETAASTERRRAMRTDDEGVGATS